MKGAWLGSCDLF